MPRIAYLTSSHAPANWPLRKVPYDGLAIEGAANLLIARMFSPSLLSSTPHVAPT